MVDTSSFKNTNNITVLDEPLLIDYTDCGIGHPSCMALFLDEGSDVCKWLINIIICANSESVNSIIESLAKDNHSLKLFTGIDRSMLYSSKCSRGN